MILRKDLERFLSEQYDFSKYSDYCENGLQVEGKEMIHSILFGVSFHAPLLDRAIEYGVDAIIVHHGIFGQGHFHVKGILKQKIKALMVNDISLFGIHLPMDGHPVIGHNALILKILGATEVEPFELGFRGVNSPGYTLDKILETLHNALHPSGIERVQEEEIVENSLFKMKRKYGFQVVENGPVIPKRIGVISGASSSFYEKAIQEGIDTFLGGDIKEHIPAFSIETLSNFVNLGHYYSEKPGVLALMDKIKQNFDVKCEFAEFENPV